MIDRILQNTRRSRGFWGKVMLFGMSNGHKPLSDWAMLHLPLAEDARMLDVGCCGGAKLAALKSGSASWRRSRSEEMIL